MTAAFVRDDFARLLAETLRGLDGEGFNDSYLGSNDPNTEDGWRSVEEIAAHLADALAGHVEPLLADLRADNDKLRDEHQAWRSAVAWQKRGLAAESKVERVEALADVGDKPSETYFAGFVATDDLRAALRGDDAATVTDPRVSIRTIEHDGGGLEITAADDYYLDEEYVTVDGRHVLRLWIRPSDEETTS